MRSARVDRAPGIGGQAAVITLDVNPLEPAFSKMVQREFTGSIMDKALLERVLPNSKSTRSIHLRHCCRRIGIHAGDRPPGERRGPLNLLEFSQREAESHGRR